MRGGLDHGLDSCVKKKCGIMFLRKMAALSARKEVCRTLRGVQSSKRAGGVSGEGNRFACNAHQTFLPTLGAFASHQGRRRQG
jgi:hypothetical protein